MKTSKIGRITLAITLIFLGIVLLLKNFIKIDIFNVLSIMWPCIIILFGLEIIITKLVYERKEIDVKTKIDVISVIILSMVVFILAITSFVRTIYLDEIGSSDFKSFVKRVTRTNYKYSQDIEDTFTISSEGKNELKVDDYYGDVSIVKGEGNEVKVEAKITYKYDDNKYGQKTVKDFLKVRENGDSIEINTSDVKDYFNRLSSDVFIEKMEYRVTLPNNLLLDLDQKYGKTNLENIEKPIDVDSNYSNMTLKNITGKLDIESGYSDISIDSVNGDVEIEDKYSEIDIKNVSGNLKADKKYGDMSLEKINNNLDIVSEYANIDIKESNKSVYIKSKYGDIKYMVANPIQEKLEIYSQYGDTDISIPANQEGNFNIINEHGEIENQLGLKVEDKMNKQIVRQTKGSGEVRININTKNENVRLNSN
ncbi:hypothetical protein CLPU_16c00540 [Gottschalkia purinilytica]|uniref:Uncharacterized protein n=1 Tax=Gottschalkia purinilytica TaxID=1503 RepID=A0A0L0W7H8_GOTPU|nr:DUF4097 family beta strand repeat-containing protein [Gottschalkia purinilytica]KNF07498.1 hypothetical protein CLPU_16c00540 [Gottschalkia purinilytica]